MAAPSGNEVDDVIRDLKKISGFTAYVILNNDGIVIKYENMSYRVAVHHAHLILSLYGKAIKYTRDLFDAPDNEVESIRMITKNYEMIIAQHGNFTLVVTQSNVKVEEAKVAVEGGEKKEGEAEKKEAVA
mmetsp:Transcript_57265/g.100578  ORF Transcript_57265/g.100578 Transcript_57265/m.100578 type:complete len:130 (-) Transcript_57265:107-496(-)|eukprot:CAMPEP_0184990254 /NCGR_PEP_ID=MMETSP1098-20130426/31669_1 /TAXON_ID=89044 /ORGANISM="Spumella elongata, Strain CCAP 955/1" /LENGTH=129 /DNA_ID=CAMNT_0027515419 /DNA_START=65 /DNA_END=454 /DNA_ORIENTATION=+